MNTKQKIAGAGLAIGLGLVAIASVIGFETMQMRVPPSYARVGPQIFPYIIAIGMALTGAFIAWKSYHGGDEVIDEVEPTDWKNVGIILLGLIAHMNLLRPVGFVPAGTRAFHERDLCLWQPALRAGRNRRILPGAVCLYRFHLRPWPATAAGDFEGIALRWKPSSALMDGFATALTPINLMWSLVGVTLGTLIGILPGIGPALTIALLLPVTRNLDPTGAFIMFAGLYYGAMYGSSTTSILLNTPGESGSIMTAIEGNLMARQGRGAAALSTAAIGSFVAGTLGTLALTFLAPLFVKLALLFGPAEYFSLMVLAFTTVSVLLGASKSRGLAALFLGLAFGLVGTDILTGQPRLVFGYPSLLRGIDIVVVAVGLFAVGEALFMASQARLRSAEILPIKGSLFMTREEWRRSWKPWLRGAGIGFPFGALPAGGTEIPTFLSYFLEKKLTKHPEEFGRGAIEGVAGPEAANNAAVAGVLVPLLALGLPTSATAAILLAAFEQYNLQPGPLLFAGNSTLVWGLIASLYIGNVMLLVLNLPLVGLWVRLLTIPQPLLYGGILIFSTLGVYSLGNSTFDLVLLFIVGFIGFLMRRHEFPVAPCIIGLILGPFAEAHFRRALSISQGDPSVFVTHPLSAVLLATAAAVIIVPIILRRIKYA